MIRVAVQADPFDLAAIHAELASAKGGAIATFTGVVRTDDGVEQLELEHYPGVTEQVLEKLANEAAKRWALAMAVVVHRVGAMRPGEAIVFVGTVARHRAAALDACAYLIDRLKTEAPFWKRETRGAERRWVEARSSDDVVADRWREPAPPPR